MNVCPPTPDGRSSRITSSSSSRKRKTASAGVSGLTVSPRAARRRAPSRSPAPGSVDGLEVERDHVDARRRRARRRRSPAPRPGGGRGACVRSPGRSAATTSGPNVMGGTKWPSMTSTWIDVGEGLDRADLIGEVGEVGGQDRCRELRHAADPTGGGSGLPTERGDEHGVAAVHGGARGERARTRPSGPSIGIGLEVGPLGQQRVGRGVGLGARERADRVHEHAAGPQQLGAADAIATWSRARPESSDRAARQSSSGRRRAEPRPLQGASTSTRSKPPRTAGARASCARTARRRRAARRSRRRGRPAPGWRSAPTTRPSRTHEAGDVRELAAGPRAHVEHPVPRLRVQRRHDERRRLILHGERPPARSRAAARARRPRAAGASGCSVPRRGCRPRVEQVLLEVGGRPRARVRAEARSARSARAAAAVSASSPSEPAELTARPTPTSRCEPRRPRRPRPAEGAGGRAASLRSTAFTNPRSRSRHERDGLGHGRVGRARA